MFSTDIATAYPAEAKVKSWVRSYALDDKKLIIGDIYTLDEAIVPNQMNFLTWGNVTFPSAGKIRIEVKGQKVTLKTEEKKVTGKYGFVIQQVKQDEIDF